MRGEAMAKVVQKLKGKGINLSQYSVLEFFAREGDWQTLAYFPHIKQLTAWEIDPAFERNLRLNLPGANIEIGNSFQLATEERYYHQFNMVVMDNPQGIYGDGFCEHFEALNLAPRLFKQKDNVLIFNVNIHPFSYETQDTWRKRREEFYSSKNTDDLTHEFLQKFYTDYLTSVGMKVKDLWLEARNDDYLRYVVCIFDLP